MKNRMLPYLILIIALALLVGGYLYLRRYAPKYTWSEQLTKNNTQPYGTSILYELTKESLGKENFHELKNPEFDHMLKSKRNTSYVFIGSDYYIDSVNIESLMEYVHRGNKALIASTRQLDNFLRIWLRDSSLIEVYSYYKTDSLSTRLFLPNPSGDSTYSFHYQFLKQTLPYSWPGFDSLLINSLPDRSVMILSTLGDGRPNFIAIEAGYGTLYLHSTPIFFSNYHLLREQTFRYLQSVWDEVISDEVFWDTYSYYPYNKASYAHLRESPLRFILKHKSFRWAWFLLLFSMVIFIMVQSKRKQQTIPIQERKENNTLDYARAMGSLYYQSGSHRYIAAEIMNQFYSFIKMRYGLKAGKDKEQIVPALSKASGISGKSLSEVVRLERKLRYDETAESEKLYRLYSLIDHFYNNCN